ncbi:hypothetical protein BKK79_01440 [Cupriavidus sp. USMAA2-4]|uniref:Uncharacterized protein n=1 Tax=Cupriavidus malaysiensis TaxID=367825 RepID=A0ABN4THI3_9BURK|nr:MULTISPECIES: hypothetical protein [Cupriavidus]AOY90636.1 hypothetical protein BKK79_01440 [Cupriavidus sp. USMAA2-4]AOY99739.1 hypothetical protein BKK81_11140 [Cupriavidus sp. USMAHM13]AOZ06363.1 hypothetical protein BKK80_11400 [Cupriavidus malaysiensis]
MDTFPSSTYKGFDLYPLVYRYDPPREWHERRPDRSYNASVVICREGLDPVTAVARIFKVRAEQWESLGVAKRAAIQSGRDIVDGLVEGENLIGL